MCYALLALTTQLCVKVFTYIALQVNYENYRNGSDDFYAIV